MRQEVFLPKLGMQMTEATVVKWLKAAGELVGMGEPLCLIETDKVETEVEAETAGQLAEIKVGEGSTVPVGTVLALIDTPE